MDRERELVHLAQADRHIAEGWERIARVEALADDMEARGWDAGEARRLLKGLGETMEEWQRHRDMIVEFLHDAD